MTSYGHLKELQEIARVMIDALKYMLENTFEQRPQGGPEIDFSGFPGWCMYVLAMYAQVIQPRDSAQISIPILIDELSFIIGIKSPS